MRVLPCAAPAVYEQAASRVASPAVLSHYFIFCQPDSISVTMHLGIFRVWRSHIHAYTHAFVNCLSVSFLCYSIEVLVPDLSIFKSFIFKECEFFVAHIVSVFSQLIICLLTVFMVLFVIYIKNFLCLGNQIYLFFVLLPLSCESWLRTSLYTEMKEKLTTFSSRSWRLWLLRPRDVYLLIALQSISRVWVCSTTNCSTQGSSVLHCFPEFAQTHVRWVAEAIQPSHLPPLPSSFAFNLSQHQGLFQWVSSSHQVAKVSALQHQSFQWSN